MTAKSFLPLSSNCHQKRIKQSRYQPTIRLPRKKEKSSRAAAKCILLRSPLRIFLCPYVLKMNVSEPKNEVKIRAEHVDFSYENTQTLFDINLEFRNHEVTALIGPSGCGKSTFLRTLSRMNELICDTTLKGKILLDGEDIYAPNYDVVQLRQRVGMVFQKPTPFPKSIFENVAYGLRVAGISSRSILAEKSKKVCAEPHCGKKSRIV